MNKETFLITDKTLETAKNICSCINDKNILNRAVANVFAAELAGEFFQDYEADTESGIHNIPTVLKEIDISDIYIQNSYIDARIYFEENDLCVPKSHFDNNILPVAYMFIKVDKELSSGCVTGFITPGEINRDNDIEGYYPVNEDQLISFYDIEPLLNASYSDDLTTDLKKEIYNYADGKQTGKEIFRELIESKDGRLLLKKACLAQEAYSELKNDELLTDIINPATDETATEAENMVEDLPELDISDNSNEELLLEPEESLTEAENIADDFPAFDISDNGNEELLLEQGESEEIEDIAADNEFTEIESDTLEEFSLDNNFDNNQNDLQINDDFSLIEENIGEEMTDVEYEPADFTGEQIDFADEHIDLLNESDSLSSEPIAETEDNILDTSDKDINDFSENGVESNDADKTEGFNITENTPEDNALETIAEEPSHEEDILNELSIEDFEEVQENIPEQYEYEQVVTVDETNEPIQENEQPIEDYNTETTPSLDTIEQDLPDKNKDKNTSENIEELFPEEDVNSEYEETINSNQKPAKKKPSIITILGAVVLLGAGIYYGYTKFSENNMPDNIPTILENTAQQPVDNTNKTQPSDMPDESLENITKDKSKNEGNSISIPSIENHLDSSVLVSNLAVTWEVPAGYINNVSAKRYFTKLGKIMQLNLKTELLLINRPPINNKIVLELQFNPDKQYFEIKDIASSSGEKVIDDVVKSTVSKTLEMNLNINLSTFGNIQGNPTLIISL